MSPAVAAAHGWTLRHGWPYGADGAPVDHTVVLIAESAHRAALDRQRALRARERRAPPAPRGGEA